MLVKGATVVLYYISTAISHQSGKLHRYINVTLILLDMLYAVHSSRNLCQIGLALVGNHQYVAFIIYVVQVSDFCVEKDIGISVLLVHHASHGNLAYVNCYTDNVIIALSDNGVEARIFMQ